MMQYLNIDYLIVYAFLAITLLIGLRAGRGIKDVREYVIANKSFGTGALVLTYLATHLAGISVFGNIGFMFSQGIIFLLALLSLIIAFLICAFFIAPKAAYFTNCLTMGDLMETFYDTKSKIISGILGFLTTISLAGMELSLLGVIGEKILHIPAQWTVILGGILLAVYSAQGGIKSVTVTDVFQFLVFIIGLPAMAYFILDKAGGIRAVFANIPADRLMVTSHEKFPFYVNFFLLWSLFPAGFIDPAIIQRWLMGKNGRQLRNQFLVIAGFDPAFRLMILFIAFSALVLYPNIEVQQVVPHIFNTLLPVGLKGLAIAGLLAINVSTIDSYLHAAGVAFVHDVVQPLTKKRYATNELSWMRYATVGLSLIAIAIALTTTDTFGLLLNSLAFTGPLLMFPLLSGIMGLKTDKKSFYTALIVTILAFISCKLFLPPSLSYLTTLSTIIVNGITFFSMHLYVNKGFATVNRAQGEAIIWKPNRNSFKSFIFTPQSIIRYSQEKVQVYGAPYILFGVFFTINYIVPYFVWPTELLPNNGSIFLLRMIGGILCGLLIVREKWANWLLPYMPTYWHFTIMYCLPFTGTIMLLFTGASIEWVVNIITIIILLFLLLDWMTTIIVGVLGIGLGYAVYRLFFGIPTISISFISKYLMIYQGIFGILIGLLFARRRQLHYDRLATDNKILAASEQEVRKAHLETFIEKIRLIKTLKNADINKLSNAVKEIRNVRNQAKTLSSSADSIDKNLRDIESSVASVALALTRVEHRAIDYLRLDVKPITIEQLLVDLQQQLPKANLHYIEQTKHQQIICDPIQLVKVIKNTVVAMPSNEDSYQKNYYLTIQDTQLTYPLPIVSPKGDYVKHLPAIRLIISQQPNSLPALADTYTPEMSSSTLPYPTNAQELLLTENQRTIKAHYGYTNVDISKQTTYDYYAYVVPADLNGIRPADMDTPDKELGVALVRANDQYPGAQSQEKAFLKDVQQKSPANIEKVKEALEIIKIYHGSVSRRSGEPYYLHPLAVAHIVLDWNSEEATIIGALLHDTIEDTPMLAEDIDMVFGPEVVRVVNYVTHFGSFKGSFYRGKLTHSENMRMLLEATDKRALYVKVADRLHNMRTIEGHKTEEKKKKIAQETLSFFVPLAKSLGLEEAAKELLNISTRVLNR